MPHMTMASFALVLAFAAPSNMLKDTDILLEVPFTGSDLAQNSLYTNEIPGLCYY